MDNERHVPDNNDGPRGRRRRRRPEGDDEGDPTAENGDPRNNDSDAEDDGNDDEGLTLLFGENEEEEGTPQVTAEDIKEMENRLYDLRRAHRRQIYRKALQLNASRAWHFLPRNLQREVPTILYCLQQNPIPSSMQWGNFERNFPARVCGNKQVLLARLKYVDMEKFDELYGPPGNDERGTPFPVNRELCSDREIMLALCLRSPQTLRQASAVLCNDPSFVLEILQEHPTVMQYLSKKLRSSKAFARKALSLPAGIRGFKFLDQKLQKDNKLAILAIEKAGEEYANNDEHLMDLPEHFRGNQRVVLEAVRKRGSNLRHLSSNSWMLKDPKIVFEAFNEEGSAMLYVPDCPARRELLENRDYLKQILQEGGGPCLSDAPEEFQKDRELIMTAVQNGYVNSVSIVQRLDGVEVPGDDMNFFLRLIEASNNVNEFYDKLPQYLQELPQVAKAVIGNTVTETLSSNTMITIARRVPSLSCDEILTAIRRGCCSFLKVSNMASLMADKDFVCMLCRNNGNCIRFANSELRRNKQCLLAAMKGEEPVPLKSLFLFQDARPTHLFWEDEDVAEALIRLAEKEDHETKMRVDQMISGLKYTNKKVFLACCETHWPNFQRNQHGFWTRNNDDHELALAVLRSLRDDELPISRNYSFLHYGSMLNRKAFVERAVLVAPPILEHNRWWGWPATFDIQLKALGSSIEAPLYLDHVSKYFNKLVSFSQVVRVKLDVIDGFALHFLGAICISSPRAKKRGRTQGKGAKTSSLSSPGVCHLPMLNLGGDHGIQRSIAEFAGITIGPKYKLMRDASSNLAFWGY